MSKLTESEIREFFNRAYSFILTEQDDPFATDEGGDDEEGADEEGGDEEGGDDPFADDAGDEEEGGDEEGGDEEGGDEAEEGPKAEEEDEVRFAKSLDDQLQAVFIDIESDSIKSAQVQEESYSLRRMLLRESENVQIDVDKFAAETARLIKNFDAFFDIELVVLSKMRSFLLDKYGEEIADEVDELLYQRHNIAPDPEEDAAKREFDEQVPIAVGATAGAGGP